MRLAWGYSLIRLFSARKKKDLETLSQLGHFLKGSSATLGLVCVRDSCEKIQHYGSHKDETGSKDEPDDEVCLSRLKTTISQAKQEFGEVEKVLRKFYKADDDDDNDS
jgi:osomolarity two-component system, phosphorelay intermediate protein YPD1